MPAPSLASQPTARHSRPVLSTAVTQSTAPWPDNGPDGARRPPQRAPRVPVAPGRLRLDVPGQGGLPSAAPATAVLAAAPATAGDALAHGGRRGRRAPG